MLFSCNGSITKWIYGGMGSGNADLQIWRQTTGGYTRTGSSSVNAGTMIGTKLFEFTPQTPLQFQEGDIFGIYISSGNFLYQQQESGPLERYRSGNSLSMITESALSSDTNNNFPLVAVEISKVKIIYIFIKILVGIPSDGTTTLTNTPTITESTTTTGGK